MTNGRLMMVKSISAIPFTSIIGLKKTILGLFESGHFTQV